VAENKYVQVAFPIPILDTFTYVVPEQLRNRVVPGSHVTAFLGRRRLSGFVVGTEPREDLKNVKPLESLVRSDRVFDGSMLELARTVADYYLCPLGEILAAAYPGHAEKGARYRSQAEGAHDGERTQAGTLPCGEWPVASIRSGATEEDGMGTGESAEAEDGMGSGSRLEVDLWKYLAPLLDASNQRRGRVFLLNLPDQARESMYPLLISRIMQSGGSVIFLIPEVFTSDSLVGLLKKRFGEEMALFHSRLRISERKSIWEKSRSGKLKLLVGTRSAVFLPARELRLIVVEDEHAEPFKQEETPRYNAKEVAVIRGRLAGVPVLLGSATPSVDSFWAASRGEMETIGGTEIGLAQPEVKVVDMRQRENVVPQSEELSLPLIAAMEKALAGHKKVLLFLNRRGFYTRVQCQDCGFLETCPRCELPLVYHSETKTMECHHCAHKIAAPVSCRKCGGTRFRYGGGGVEKVQTRLKRFFPNARIARVDFDSARTRPDALRIAASFTSGDIDILVGTLIVTKGLELGEISLAGVIHAETGLNLPDFRSGERAFQILSDVVSLVREGGGEVIVQTLNPQHHSLRAVVEHEPRIFYEQELKERKELGYPPFSTLISFHVIGANEAQVMKVVRQMGTLGSSISDGTDGTIRILGPSPAIPTKLKGRFRWYMSVRGAVRQAVVEAAKGILSEFGGKHEIGGVTISVDVDPVGVLR